MSVSSQPFNEPPGARPDRFPALDGMRAIAALLVVCTHVGFISGRSLDPDLLGPLLSRGDFGVTVFFLLSGFLLYRPFALHSVASAPRPAVGRFLWRRALRILPALYICIAVVLSLITVYRVRASDWLQYMLVIQTYDHHDYDPNLTQLWTLAVELSFYVSLPILAGLVGRAPNPNTALRRQAALLTAMALVAACANVYQSKEAAPGSQAQLWLPFYLDWFALGMGLSVLTCAPADATAFAALRRTLQVWADSPGTCWLLSGILYLLSTLPLGIPRNLAPAAFWQWTLQHYLYAGAAFFLMLPLTLGRPGMLHRVLGCRAGSVLGNLSYSVYLWHVPMMLLIQRKLGYGEFKGHFLAILVLTLATSSSIAAASWYLLERPILRYGSRPWRPSRTGVSRAGPGSAEPKAAADTASAQIT
jgi:peptidoglycan/LPS O-acetylase OafA/YrhL